MSDRTAKIIQGKMSDTWCRACPTLHAICDNMVCTMCRECPTKRRAAPVQSGWSIAAIEAIRNDWDNGLITVPSDWSVYKAMDWGCSPPDVQPQPAPPPKALPFVYMDACYEAEKHDGTMCLSCERTIAKITATRALLGSRWRETHPPQRPEPYQPSASGLGSVCGPVLSRLRP